MHFEVLVEDASGSIMMSHLLPKILGLHRRPHTWRIHSYKGVGNLPPNLHKQSDARKRILLQNLPRLLQGYGKAFHNVPDAAVLVVVDSDKRDCRAFKKELTDVLEVSRPAPITLFRIAIEEMEAWLLGDRQAIRIAYPKAKNSILDRYVQDSICGTWEILADVIHPGGARVLRDVGFPVTGQVKCEWAARISPHIDVDRNLSRSFKTFRSGLMRLATASNE